MRAKRFIPKAAAVAAVIFFVGVGVLAAVTTFIVFPGQMQAWQTNTAPGAQPNPATPPSVSFVFGPATPPLNRGSAQLSVGSDGGALAQLRQPDYAGTALPNPNPDPDSFPAGNELTALSYSTYVQVGGSGAQAPFIALDVDYDGNGTVDDHLIFEPQYQIAGFCPSNPQGPGATGVAPGSGPGANVKPLTAFSAAQPSATIVNAADGGGGVHVVAGLGGVVGGGAADRKSTRLNSSHVSG